MFHSPISLRKWDGHTRKGARIFAALPYAY